MDIQFTSQLFKEGKMYIAYTPELDVSSCGPTKEKAQQNLLEAVRLFLEEAEKMGTLDQILEEAGYVKYNQKLKSEGPKFLSAHRLILSVSLAHAET